MKPTPWLPFAAGDPAARLRLFCFPYAAAGASVFRRWQGGLPRGVEVCAVELPGRGTRDAEPPAERMDELVEGVLEGLAPWIDRPYALFGHSVGGLVAFEVARALRGAGLPEPEVLFASASRAPRTPHKGGTARELGEGELLERMRRLGGTPPELLDDPALMDRRVRAFRGDVILSQEYRYTPGPPLHAPVHALVGSADALVPREQAAGWRAETRGPFRLRSVPGGHFFLHTAEPFLLRIVGSELGGAHRRPLGASEPIADTTGAREWPI